MNPTTTVSACKEGHKKDCDMLSNVGIPKAQKDESYCTCGVTTNTPTETTVEKWEEIDKVYWDIHTHSSDEVMEARHKAVIARLKSLYASSVQEAKAERDREIMEEINSEHERLMEVTRGTFPDRYSNDYLHGILRGYTLLGRFMASLKQEEVI